MIDRDVDEMLRARTIRKVLKWFALFLLVAVAAAGGFAYWMWSQADEKLRQVLIARQRELAPDWDMQIPRAHFDWSRRVHIYDVTIKARGHAEPVLRLPEIVITIDRERFRETQEVVVQKVRLINPDINMTRDGEGRWNWQELLKVPKSDRPLPEWEIEQGRVVVRLEHPAAGPPAVMQIEDCNARIVPAASRQYVVMASGQVNEAGDLAARGQWNIDARQWNVDGAIHHATTSGELLRLAAGASPELRSKLQRVDAALRRYKDSTQGVTLEPVALADESDELDVPWPPVGSDVVPDFGIRCTLDVNFRIEQAGCDVEPDFRMLVELRQGQMDHDVLPFPLRDLEGEVYWDNRQIVLRRVTAKNGLTQVSMSGRFERLPSSATPGSVDVRLSKLPLDERLRSRLPPLLAKQFDLLQPTGQVDLDVTCLYDGAGHWAYRDVNLTALGCTATNQRFPYPVTGLLGSVRQQPGGDFAVRLEGRAGRRPVTIVGEIKRPGPEAEARFDVRVERLPMDDRFREACPPAVRKTLAAMRAEGWIDAAVRLHRPPGPAMPFQTELVARLHECSIKLESFPYRVSELSGVIRYHTKSKIWNFDELAGRHGAATLTGTGVFRQDQAPQTLELLVVAKDADLDGELERALPDSLRRVWADLNPTGRAKQVEVRLAWAPGGEVAIAIPKAEISGGTLKLAAWPWPLTDVAAELAYADHRVEIRSFSGWHDETRVYGSPNPAGQPAGFAVAEPDGGWQLRFEKLHIDDLTPDRRFRETVPPDLRSVIEELNPRRQPLSIAGMVHLRGGGPAMPIVTAAWDVSVYFAGSELTVGTALKDLHGRVTTSGTWDGRRINMQGDLDLDSVYVLDYQFTQVRGPFRLIDQRVEFGSAHALYSDRPTHRASIAASDQITATAIGGLVSVNGTARLGPRPTYEMRIALREGRLEQYARQYLPGTKHLAGLVNGDVVLDGRGPNSNDLSGRGGVRISQAALYELPVVARVLGTLNTLAPPDKTAFKYADLEFEIAQSQFRFQRIDLVGDAISLRGRGSVGFDGQVRLDFYSMMPRTRLPIGAIPGVNAILGEATKGWVGVKVTGKASNPRTEATAVPVLDDALRQFLRAFESGPSSMVPRLLPPN